MKLTLALRHLLCATVVLSGIHGICQAPAAAESTTTLHSRDRYRLHSGDTLMLEYRLSPELNQTVILGPDGYVDLNVAGAVRLAGMTLVEAHDAILQKDAARMNQPELNLQLKDFQRTYVMVAGQVMNPHPIEMREDMTALQAVMLAGGFRDSAKESKVVIYRRLNSHTDMAEVHVINLHRLQKTKELERDMQLSAGDIVYVPENNTTQFSKIMRIPNFSMSSGVPLY